MKKNTKRVVPASYHKWQLALVIFVVLLLLTAFINTKHFVDQTNNAETKNISYTINAASEPTVPPTERYSPFLEDKIPMSKEMFLYTVETAEQYGLDPELVFAVMKVESNFDFHAMSEDKSCIGIMQVHEINYEELRNRIFITNLGDPFENIKAGCFILSELLEKYPLERALVCYNCGENGSKAETTEYSRAVIEAMNDYE